MSTCRTGFLADGGLREKRVPAALRQRHLAERNRDGRRSAAIVTAVILVSLPYDGGVAAVYRDDEGTWLGGTLLDQRRAREGIGGGRCRTRAERTGKRLARRARAATPQRN